MLAFVVTITGCSRSSFRGSTPVVQKQAKRAYNKPYKIKGKKYLPRSQYEYVEEGIASYYGGRDVFHGRKTSTGETFSKNGLTAAHKTLPLPSIVRVTNLKNGRSIKLRINDRGPFVRGRIIDVSEKSARLLGFHRDGITKVRVECLVGESMRLAHSYNPKKSSPYTLYGNQPRRGSRSAAAQTRSTARPTVRQLVDKKLSTLGANSGATSAASSNMTSGAPKKPNRISLYSADSVNLSGKILPRGTYIQVGTYSSPINANNFAYKVQTRMRVPTNAYPIEKNGQEMYRVLVGPMQSKGATEKMLHELKIRNVTDAFVVVQK